MNTIIGDAFKLAYAKQRMPLQQQYGSVTGGQLPLLSSLHPVNLVLPPTFSKEAGPVEEESNTPSLLIPPPPPTSPPPPLLTSNASLDEEGENNKDGQETQCNG